MNYKSITLAAAAAATMIGASAANAATVNISTEAGQDYRTVNGIRDDTSTRGVDLVGMEIMATYANGTSETLVWGDLGGAFGVSSSNMQLTFGSTDWDLSTSTSLTSFTINAVSVNSMFDILRMSDGDTPTTGRGFAFSIRDANIHEGEIDVTYRNQIRYRNQDFEGDTFTEMTVDFSGLWGGGLLGDLAFSTDLDTLRYAGDLAPVPLPGGLPLVASGALLLGLVRRKKR